jgi:hypothetical protein
MKPTTISDVIKQLEERVTTDDAQAAWSRMALDGARMIQQLVPGAMHMPGANATHYFAPGIIPDSVDPIALYVPWPHTSSSAPNVLFKNIPIIGGSVRIYSTVRVDILAGFKAYNESGGAIPLVECLMATADAAQKAFESSEAERLRLEQEHAAAKAAQQVAQQAQPVRIVADDTKPAPTPAS